MEISYAVTAQLIRAFVVATGILQFLYFLNTKITSSRLPRPHSLVCVSRGRKHKLLVCHAAAQLSMIITVTNTCISKTINGKHGALVVNAWSCLQIKGEGLLTPLALDCVLWQAN